MKNQAKSTIQLLLTFNYPVLFFPAAELSKCQGSSTKLVTR